MNASDRVVARLRYPMPAAGLDHLGEALRNLYGTDLVIVLDGDDYDEGWMTISRPEGDMTP